MSLQVFGIDGESLLEFFDGVGVALLKKEDTAKLVAHDTVTWELRKHGTQMSDRAVVLAFFFESAGVEVVGARQLRADGERFLQDLARADSVSFLKEGTANVGPTVGILRIGFRDFLEGRSGGFQIALQEQADAVIVPARPVFLGRDNLWRGRGSGSGENAQSPGVLGNDDDGKVGNCLEVAGDLRSVAVELPVSVVVVRRGRGGRCARIAWRGFIGFDAREREMRIEPTELAIVEFGVKRNLVAGIVRNVEAIVRSVRGPRRDQMDVNHGASGPGISFVDGIAVAIDLERTVEVGARLDGAFAVVLNFAAPENSLPFIVSGLQLEPDIEGVHCAAGEEVADLASAHNHIHTGVIAAAHERVSAIDRSSDGADFASGAFRDGSIRFFANGEGGREFRLSQFAARRDVSFFACRRNRENIHGELLVLQEFLRELVLYLVLVGCWNSRVRAGEAMRMHESFHISVIERRDRRHVAIGAVHGRLGIVEGARALARNAAGLPVVIFIEAANPAVTIHGDIEVDFVAGRTELRSIRAHERLQESAAMRFGVQANDEIVQLAEERIFAGGELMELRIFQEEITLAHGAFHFHNAVAHQAAEAGARLRAVDDLLDRSIEKTTVKQGGVVAAGAPLGGAHA